MYGTTTTGSLFGAGTASIANIQTQNGNGAKRGIYTGMQRIGSVLTERGGEALMKYPEYDSPLGLIIGDLATQAAKSIDEMSWQAVLQAVQDVGINVDKDKLLAALNQDAERYREAYANGHHTGYEKRDDEIVRCKDCVFAEKYAPGCSENEYRCVSAELQGCDAYHDENWYCADGRRYDDA